VKILVEVNTDLVFKKDAEEIINEIMYGGIDMMNHSSDVKDGISWEFISRTEPEWDADANI